MNAIVVAIIITLVCVLFIVGGCVRGHGNARGAGTIEELVKKYEAAHRERSVEELRDILWWESPQAGSGHRRDYEQLMSELFAVELTRVEFEKGPEPHPQSGSIVSYVRERPGQKAQINSVAGPVYGKLILVGSVDGAAQMPVPVDPGYVVMQSLDRYYIDIEAFALQDTVDSVRTGKPSRSKPIPLGADPDLR